MLKHHVFSMFIEGKSIPNHASNIRWSQIIRKHLHAKPCPPLFIGLKGDPFLIALKVPTRHWLKTGAPIKTSRKTLNSNPFPNAWCLEHAQQPPNNTHSAWLARVLPLHVCSPACPHAMLSPQALKLSLLMSQLAAQRGCGLGHKKQKINKCLFGDLDL